jgi:hypothetical protein
LAQPVPGEPQWTPHCQAESRNRQRRSEPH